MGGWFVRTLHADLSIPIGLIANAWGGTRIQAWLSREALSTDPVARLELEPYERLLYGIDPANVLLYSNPDEWFQAEGPEDPVNHGIENGWHLPSCEDKNWATMDLPQRWQDAGDNFNGKGPGGPNAPYTLFHSRLAPLIPYAIRGWIWYQGESNTSEPALYRRLLPLLILDWRRAWGQGDLPFLIVQLANYQQAHEDPTESLWAELRPPRPTPCARPIPAWPSPSMWETPQTSIPKIRNPWASGWPAGP